MRMQEKREFVRWRIGNPAWFKLLDEPQEEKKAALRDISFAGAQLFLSENLRLNDKLDMCLDIPDEQNSVHCQAKVVWQKSASEETAFWPFICGLRFTELLDEDRDRIFQYVRKAAPESVWERWWEEIK